MHCTVSFYTDISFKVQPENGSTACTISDE
jgi:hypothetical protein